MLAYYILVIIPMLFSLFAKSNKLLRKQNNEIVLFFSIMILLLAFRDISCGVDTTTYFYKFQRAMLGKVDFSNILSEREPLFYLLEVVFAKIFGNFRVFLIACALISLWPIVWFYKEESDMPVLSIVLFLELGTFPMYFSGLRQSIAMGFAVVAWLCVKKKKLVLFLLVVTVATMFHNSAIILLLLYPSYHVNFTRKSILYLVPIIAIIFVYNEQVFSFLGRIVENYSERYVASIRSTGAYAILVLFVLFAVYSFVIPNDNLDQETIALRNIMVLCVVIQCFATINTLAMRVNYYFITFIPILIPRIIERSSKQMKKIARFSQIVFIVFFTFYFFYQAYTDSDILQIFPYIPFWKG